MRGRERERADHKSVRTNTTHTHTHTHTHTQKKKRIHYSLPTPQTKPIKVLVGYRVLHGAATSHQTNLMVDESMKVEV